jgi:hypothetical protein
MGKRTNYDDRGYGNHHRQLRKVLGARRRHRRRELPAAADPILPDRPGILATTTMTVRSTPGRNTPPATEQPRSEGARGTAPPSRMSRLPRGKTIPRGRKSGKRRERRAAADVLLARQPAALVGTLDYAPLESAPRSQVPWLGRLGTFESISEPGHSSGETRR